MAASAKRIFPWIAVAAVVAGIAIALRTHHASPSISQENAAVDASSRIAAASNPSASAPAARSADSTVPSTPAAPKSAAAVSSTAPAAPKPETPFVLGTADTAPAMDPETVVSNMRIVIRNYASMFNGNPVGTNPEITAELNGGNPKGARFIKEDSGLRINGRGELVDYWGTPFFFHQLSANEMEIRSAGPDRKMWTADDIVTK